MKVLFLFITLTFSISSFASGGCEVPESKLTARPVVKVSPVIDESVKDQDCALISFQLKEKQGTNGRALVATSIKIETSTNEELATALKEAVSKWLFFSSTHNKEDTLYFSYVYSM